MPYKLLIACIFLYSCSGSRWVETNLYFGQMRPDGTMVTNLEWNNFRSNQMASVFKHGCTVINTSGNWLDPETHKLITEPGHVVIYYYKNSRQMSQQIDSLRKWYVSMFQQQSVLRVDKKAKVSF